MPHRDKKNVYVERDRHGRERLVLSGGPRRSSSSERGTSDLLDAARQEIQSLEGQIGTLQTRLSFEESKQWNGRREHERLTAENYNLQRELEAQVQEARRLEDLLYDEEKKNEKLEGKYRALKRDSSRSRSGSSEYRRAFEEKAQEVELLRVRLQERDDLIRLDAARIAEKNQALAEKNQLLGEKNQLLREQNQLLREQSGTIAYFKKYLREHGFRVED